MVWFFYKSADLLRHIHHFVLFEITRIVNLKKSARNCKKDQNDVNTNKFLFFHGSLQLELFVKKILFNHLSVYPSIYYIYLIWIAIK